MLRNDLGHKTQFGVDAQSAADLCLVLGGSSRLAGMVYRGVRADDRTPSPMAENFIWQRRAPDAAMPEAVLFDPLAVADDPQATAGVLRVAVEDGARKIGTVICFAGVIGADAAALAVNTDLAIATLKIARTLGARRVVLCSSAAVYGAQSGPMAESAPLAPMAPYGHAKARMEYEAQAWRDAHAPQVELCILRIGNVAGADALLGGAASGGPVTLDVFADGHGPRRSYIGPKCFAGAIARLVQLASVPPVLNLCRQGPVAMDDLLDAAGIGFARRAAGSNAIACVELDCTLCVALGLVPAQPACAHDLVAQMRADGRAQEEI
ncbi:NAD-dependent epimerase/dehydratase family protein [Albirhodobacter sp. R86504]|uniref:NAD-dependent epimerase/dehydratase family protein n=1 Tax=Albirhodobacter sp. R86504 TaxID=3093848 RepID=UPI00366F6929